MVINFPCPVPPGFEPIGTFNDEFENFKTMTWYSHFDNENGIDLGLNFGVSKRWKNSNIRSDGIVCGFQFKIGPTVGVRTGLTEDTGFPFSAFGKVRGGDINVHFPRRDGPGGDRGGYIASLKWFTNRKVGGGLLTEGEMGKEIPHGEYHDKNHFKIKIPNVLSQTNLKANLENPVSDPELEILDGEWHSFLAIAYNDWYFRFEPDNPQEPTIGKLKGSPELLPVIGLWYSDTPTTNFNDFKLLGMGMDLGNMKPRGPLKEGIGDDDHPIIDIGDILDIPNIDSLNDFIDSHNDIFLPGVGSLTNLFSNNAVGDDLFRAEHALQIRIDDVPENEIEIRNVYAASVKHVGIRSPQSFSLCGAEARVINDIQAKIQDLQTKLTEAQSHLTHGFGSPEFEAWRQFSEQLNERIANASCELHAAEFNYLKCPKSIIVVNPDLPNSSTCGPLEEAVKQANKEVVRLTNIARSLAVQLSAAHSDLQKEKLEDKLTDIEDNHLSPAKEKLTAARAALDKCLHPDVHL